MSLLHSSSLCQHVLAHTHTNRKHGEEGKKERKTKRLIERIQNVCEDFRKYFYYFHYRSLNKSDLYTPFSSIFLKLSFTLWLQHPRDRPYHVSLVFSTFTDIFPCSNSSPMKIGIRYSAFRVLPGTSFWKNSLNPSSSVVFMGSDPNVVA